MSQILLIEPDRVLAEIYRQAMEGKGHQVSVCASAQAGVFVADQIEIDLAVVELQLVEHSGIEFLYEFRSYKEWQKTPIIIHSHVPPAEFSSSWNILKHELGISEYLYKPATNLETLINTIDGQLAVIS
jgi:DNA-binding response OmpR family regulator